jgi:hypothetical protein
MSRRATSERTQAAAPQGDLARLLETERRLEERLQAARLEANGLIARVRLEAEQREQAFAAELDAEAQRLADALEAERQRREAEIAAAAGVEAEAYDRVPAARLAAVARDLAARLIEQEPAP